MTTRGVHKPGAAMVNSHMLGAFRSDSSTRREFLAMIGRGRGVEQYLSGLSLNVVQGVADALAALRFHQTNPAPAPRRTD